MGLIYLLSGLTLGAVLVRRVPFPMYLFEKVAVAVVVGLFGWTWLAFLAVLVFPYDVGLPLVVVLTAALTVAFWRTETQPSRPLEGGKKAWWVWGVASVIVTALLARLFWTHSLPRDAEGIFSAGASWADYGLHVGFINHIAAFSSLPSDLPIASGEKMTYPFLIDLLSGLYVQGGMSIQAALFIPGLLLCLAITQLIISVGVRLFGRISVGVGGLGLALTIGSAAGAWAAWGDWRDSGKGFFAFLGELPKDYTQVDDSNAHVTNFVVDALLPQRAILFGVGVGLVVLTLMLVSRERKEPRLLWPAGVLVGLLPMAHAHSFLVGLGLLVWLALDAARSNREQLKAFLGPIGVALILALPQLIWQQTANGHGTGGRFRLWWMMNDGETLPAYWWANFGLMGLAIVAIPIVMRKDKRVFWFLPMLVVLAITQVYAFQPFEYDNLKLIYWVYLLAGFYVAYLAGELIRKHKAWLVAIVPLTLLVVTPGALAIKREFQLKDQFASIDDIDVAKWAAKNTPVDSVWAGVDRPNVPVATLAGRTLVTGYSGWLFNFSVPYDERQQAVRAALVGDFDNPLLRKFGADYLLVAANEDPAWTVDNDALGQRPVEYSNNTWRVYKLPDPGAAPLGSQENPIEGTVTTPDPAAATSPDGAQGTSPDGAAATSPDGAQATTP